MSKSCNSNCRYCSFFIPISFSLIAPSLWSAIHCRVTSAPHQGSGLASYTLMLTFYTYATVQKVLSAEQECLGNNNCWKLSRYGPLGHQWLSEEVSCRTGPGRAVELTSIGGATSSAIPQRVCREKCFVNRVKYALLVTRITKIVVSNKRRPIGPFVTIVAVTQWGERYHSTYSKCIFLTCANEWPDVLLTRSHHHRGG